VCFNFLLIVKRVQSRSNKALCPNHGSNRNRPFGQRSRFVKLVVISHGCWPLFFDSAAAPTFKLCPPSSPWQALQLLPNMFPGTFFHARALVTGTWARIAQAQSQEAYVQDHLHSHTHTHSLSYKYVLTHTHTYICTSIKQATYH
jgi:hypothetical protein